MVGEERRGGGGVYSLTLVRFQVDPAVLGSNGIVHLTKVDSCKALRVVADFQLPSHYI